MPPCWRCLVYYDPRSHLMKVKCPILGINGENDQHAVAKDNLEGIEKALKAGGNEQSTVREFQGLNYNFLTTGIGAESEYIVFHN